MQQGPQRLHAPGAELQAQPLHALGELGRRQRALPAAVHGREPVGDAEALVGQGEADPSRDGAPVQQPQLARVGQEAAHRGVFDWNLRPPPAGPDLVEEAGPHLQPEKSAQNGNAVATVSTLLL